MPVVRPAILTAALLVAVAGCGSSTEPTTNPVPTLSSLSGAGVATGDTLVVTVNGNGFVRASTLTVNNRPVTARYVNNKKLETRLFIGPLREATVVVSVTNPAPGGGVSEDRVLTWKADPTPEPKVTSLSPAFALVGSDSVTVRLTGSGFVKESAAYLENSTIPLPPLRVLSPTSATVTVPKAQFTSQGVYRLVVVNPAPGGGLSAPLNFEVRAPSPVLTGLRQTSVPLGGASLTLIVDGTGVVDSSVVQVNGTARATRRTGPTTLEATLTNADLADPRALQVTIASPAPGGGVSSALPFTVTATVPTLTLLPLTGGTTSAGFELSVHGTNFARNSVVRWNNGDLPTTYVSGRRLVATVPGAQASTPTSASIAVFTPGVGGGSSASLPFTLRPFSVAPATSLVLPRLVADLAYSDVTRTLFASVTAADSLYPNRLIEIDVNTGAVLRTVQVGTDLSVLALSDDGRQLYVGANGQNAVRRLDVSTLTPTLDLPLGGLADFGGTFAYDIAVLPGRPGSVAVSRRYRGSSGPRAATLIFDDAIPRAVGSPEDYGGTKLAFAGSDSVLYGFLRATSAFNLYRFRTDASGLTLQRDAGGIITGFSTEVIGARERIYGSDGVIVDGESMASIGSWTRIATAVHVDPLLGRGYAMFNRLIEVVDLNSRTSLGSVPVSEAGGGPFNPTFVSRIVRCGTHCLAWTDGRKVVLVRSSSFGP